MKTPSEMTNAELASLLEDGSTLTIQGNAEIAKRLRAMSEPKPEFVPGWVGRMANGMEAEIHGSKEDFLIGVRLCECGFNPDLWNEDGTALEDDDFRLIPNTPPEIWWRDAGSAQLYGLPSHMPEGVEALEKVSVQVIP